jgi:16S rRNA (cytosine1402-N4)-methyltransferase
VLAGIAFHSLEDRRLKRFLGERARGCICPPELPVCVCGREPQAALITRRAIVASVEELDRNPRAGSARLRAARKLTEGQVS